MEAALDTDRVVHSFAGLGVLPRGSGDTAPASRHHLVATGPTGLISIAGGKRTTHRPIAVDVLGRLPTEIRPRRIEASPAPLPGVGGSTGDLLRWRLDPVHVPAAGAAL